MSQIPLFSYAALSGALLIACAGCTGVDTGSEDGDSQDTTTEHADAFRHGTHRWTAPRVTPPVTASKPDAGTPAAPPPPAATQPSSTDLGIPPGLESFYTPDGSAIPQDAGPNGECPVPLVRLGIWSCLQIGETCSFTSNVVHQCTCVRVDGEGQTPAWLCDPPTTN